MKASGEEQRGGGTAPVVVAVFLPCRAVIAFVVLPVHLVSCTGTLFSLRLSFSREERYAPSPRAVHREKDALRVLSPLRELTLAAVFAVPVEYLETLSPGPLHRAAALGGGARDAFGPVADATVPPHCLLRVPAAPGEGRPGVPAAAGARLMSCRRARGARAGAGPRTLVHRAAALRGGVRDADAALTAAGARLWRRLRRADAPGDEPRSLFTLPLHVKEGSGMHFVLVANAVVPLLRLHRGPLHIEEGSGTLILLSPLREHALAAVFAVPAHLETQPRNLFTVPPHLRERSESFQSSRGRHGPDALPSSRAAALRGGARQAALAAAGALTAALRRERDGSTYSSARVCSGRLQLGTSFEGWSWTWASAAYSRLWGRCRPAGHGEGRSRANLIVDL